jgi:hypothetical protein
VLRAGERVGDWIVEAPLGEGGMGAVYRVHSAMSHRVVAALKVMKPSDEPDARARFVREAEALSALRHPALVRIMGFNEDPERGLLYLVMERVEGETLRERMHRGPMELAEALATFVPLAQGLDHAHFSGISHRDLKPSNVILSHDGSPRLVDFGIAAARQSEPLTTTGQLGTLPYLPPEVFRGEPADPPTMDVYALGLLIYEALTGQRAFKLDPGLTPAAGSASVGVRKLESSALELPAQFAERLRELVRRASAPDPRARPTMRELRQGLESLVERRAAAPESGRMVPLAAPVPDDEPTTRVPDPEPLLADPSTVPVPFELGEPVPLAAARASVPRSRRRGGRVLAAVLVTAAVIALALVFLARRPGNDPVAASESGAPAPRAARPAGTRPARTAGSPLARSTPAAGQTGSPRAAATPGERPTPSPRATASPARVAAASPALPPMERIEESVPEPSPDPGPPDGSAPVAVAGTWYLTHQIASTTYQPFMGMRLGYRLLLVQEGARVRGRGHKVSENGEMLPPGRRTPIEVTGRVEGDQLLLNFTEIGAARTSHGRMRLTVGPGGTLSGRFASDAANSSGTSSARRLN